MSFGRRTAGSANTYIGTAPSRAPAPVAAPNPIQGKPSALGAIIGALAESTAVRTVVLLIISVALTQGPALFFPPPGVAIKTGRIVTGVVSGKDRNTKIVDGKPTQVYVVYVTVPDSIYKDTVTVTKQKWQDVEAGDPFEVKH